MNKAIDIMAMLVSGNAIADSELIAIANLELDRELIADGFNDLHEVRQRMLLPIRRLVHAQNVAMDEYLKLMEMKL